MTSTRQIIETIEGMKSELASRYGVQALYLFGSYARNEQTEQSDVDLLVDFKTVPDLLTFLEIEEFIADKVGSRIDLVPKRKLKDRLKAQILKEAIAV